MANFTDLKKEIAQTIKNNGRNEITGNLLQRQLHYIIDSVDNVFSTEIRGINTKLDGLNNIKIQFYGEIEVNE